MYEIDLMPEMYDDRDENYDTPRPKLDNHSRIDTTKELNNMIKDQYLDTSRPMTKAELADRLCISPRTLRNWLQQIDADSIPGYRKRGKIIVPGVLRVLAEKFCL